jgi:DeoR/GlpR family transcriptional regulator of sugar metabolism
VEKKGSISWAEAASSCQISLDQAYRLLQQLVKKGKLRKVGGAGRAVQYELKNKRANKCARVFFAPFTGISSFRS